MKKGWAIGLIGITTALGLGVLVINSLASLAQARAAEHTARAVQTAMASQAMMTAVLSGVILFLVVVVILLGAVGVMWLRARRQAREAAQIGVAQRQGKWLPGPNANWGRRLGAGQERISPETLARAVELARLMESQVGMGGGSDLTIRSSENDGDPRYGGGDPYEDLFR